MTHLPFAVQAFAWAFTVGFILLLILLNVAAIWRIGRPEFIWFDMWVGAFWDAKKRLLYIAPLPCFVFIYHLPKRKKSNPNVGVSPGWVEYEEEDYHQGK